MSYASEYRPDGQGHPWQAEPDNAKALRMYIDHVAGLYPGRPAWIVTETGGGQWFTAFSRQGTAELFAAGRDMPHEDALDVGGDGVQPRVTVTEVSWPEGSGLATVLSYLDDSDPADYLLVVPPVPVVAWEEAPVFRSYGLGGPDNVEHGYVSVLELDGGTEAGGW